jgi:hypothetical protein
VLEFTVFYIKLIKLNLPQDLRVESVVFIADVEYLAVELCKAHLLDASMFQYRPSVIAAAIVFLAI